MRPYTSHNVMFSPRYVVQAKQGEGRRTRGRYGESKGGARQRFKREAREAVRYEPKPKQLNFIVTKGGAFTCPRGCKCYGACPRFN